MLTFKVTFVQTTLVTFVYISNIKVITLTKIFGPKCFFEGGGPDICAQFFLDQISFDPNIFGPTNVWDLTFLQKKIFNSIFIPLIILDLKSFLDPKFFVLNFLDLNFFYQNFFSDPKFFFWPNIFLGHKIFFCQKSV